MPEQIPAKYLFRKNCFVIAGAETLDGLKLQIRISGNNQILWVDYEDVTLRPLDYSLSVKFWKKVITLQN